MRKMRAAVLNAMRNWPRPSHASVVAYLALFVALGGSAYAVTQLPARSVGSKQLKKGAVTPSKVAGRTVELFRGQTGVRGPAGLTGARGLQGVTGGQGKTGRDGAAVAVRARSTGTVHTPDDHSAISVPLTANTWTQAPNEVDVGPYGSITFTPPPAGSCGGTGAANLNVQIFVDGKPVLSPSPSVPPGSAAKVFPLGGTGNLFEPGTAQAHTVTAKVASGCDSGSFPADFTVSDLRLDFVRAL
jgi:hypothetical protein